MTFLPRNIILKLFHRNQNELKITYFACFTPIGTNIRASTSLSFISLNICLCLSCQNKSKLPTLMLRLVLNTSIKCTELISSLISLVQLFLASLTAYKTVFCKGIFCLRDSTTLAGSYLLSSDLTLHFYHYLLASFSPLKFSFLTTTETPFNELFPKLLKLWGFLNYLFGSCHFHPQGLVSFKEKSLCLSLEFVYKS